ncbi:hypothetical protein PVAND_012259 [Polypedilum vanderplanki]|uniref:Protein tipE n=1 Tax=Polypedilum vanderplanki TaxID=319348 RepID=A0A9J6CMU8_POLVA|nr:hypothetical protein PVAND_012259 [Polypedilum vanderplanki]
MRSVNDLRSSQSTLSAAPSIPNSKSQTSIASSHSHTSQKSTLSIKSKDSDAPLTREEIIAAYLEKAKWYTSVCLGTTAILSVFAFLFLIPFVVDPAISALTLDFQSEPVTCVVSEHIYFEGITNCTWSSCREGCTNAQTRCHQLTVNYTKILYKDWVKNPIDLELVDWDVADTRFLINTEGCGYPPFVNCTNFAKEYGHNNVGTKTFPCYYSRAEQQKVVARFNVSETIKHLILSIIIPNVLFAISIGVLSYWYCPCSKNCSRKPRVYAEFPSAKENKLLVNSSDNENSDDEDEY